MSPIFVLILFFLLGFIITVVNSISKKKVNKKKAAEEGVGYEIIKFKVAVASIVNE